MKTLSRIVLVTAVLALLTQYAFAATLQGKTYRTVSNISNVSSYTDSPSDEASFSDLGDLCNSQPQNPEAATNREIAESLFVTEFPTDLPEEDQILLAVVLYQEAKTRLVEKFGTASLETFSQALSAPIDPERLAQLNRAYFLNLLSETKAKMSVDPAFAEQIQDDVPAAKVKCTCTINGKSVRCWMCITIIIIVIIIII